MKKKVICILVVTLALVLLFQILLAPSCKIYLCRDESMLSDFYVEDNIVHILCILVIENRGSTDATVSINAVSDEDVFSKLLASPQLFGFDVQTGNQYFEIKSKERLEILIDFRGEYGGTEQKFDRMIPDIISIELQQ